VRATMGGVLIAVTLLTSVSNAQRSAPPPQTGSAVELDPVELHPSAHSSEATPTTPQTPISSLPTATPAAPNTAPLPSPSQQAETTSSEMANVQRLHARPGQLEGRRTRALGSYLEREARECIRRNIPMLYESGGYGGDQAISFFKKRCFRQPGFGELAESRFGVLVIQEFSPEEWGRAQDNDFKE
jgi:hypothetical protein